MSLNNQQVQLTTSRRLVFRTASFLTLLVLLAQADRAFGQATDTFYIDNGRGIQKVENGDPTKIKVREWQVRLYKRGQAPAPNREWGLITGNSAASVMAKLKSSQDFELRYNAWIGKGRVPDDVYTNFNPLGPIAVVEKEPTQQEADRDKKRLIPKDVWDRIQNVYGRAKAYYDGYQRLIDITSVEPKTTTPFDNVGKVFREYTDQLREAFERVSRLRQSLEGALAPAMEEIGREIDEINRSLDLARNSAERVSAGFGIKQDEIVPPGPALRPDSPAATGNDSSEKKDSQLERKLEDLTNQMTNAFENLDPSNPNAVFQRVNNIAREMLRLIESSSEADANMKELARLLLSMTETTDPEALASKLQRLAELLERINR